MASKDPEVPVVVNKEMNLFPVYILGMLARAWLFSGEGKFLTVLDLVGHFFLKYHWFLRGELGPNNPMILFGTNLTSN